MRRSRPSLARSLVARASTPDHAKPLGRRVEPTQCSPSLSIHSRLQRGVLSDSKRPSGPCLAVGAAGAFVGFALAPATGGLSVLGLQLVAPAVSTATAVRRPAGPSHCKAPHHSTKWQRADPRREPGSDNVIDSFEVNVNPIAPWQRGHLHLLHFRSACDGQCGPRSSRGVPLPR